MIIPIITGPTSSGKSGTAFNAALKTGIVEIISADAFQVYTNLDIGTAKVSRQEQQQVKHHLIDIMQPDECYSAGMFVQQAEKLIDDIIKRTKVPVITGGTGLYIKSLTDGIFNCPEIESSVREELQKKAEKEMQTQKAKELQEELTARRKKRRKDEQNYAMKEMEEDGKNAASEAVSDMISSLSPTSPSVPSGPALDFSSGSADIAMTDAISIDISV